jgi:ComF family protein
VDLVRAAFVYGGPLPRLLHAFKYEGREEAGRALADWTAQAFRRTPGFEDADALVPVPLHPSRERARGFNQALGLARALARTSGLPVRRALVRIRPTRPQWRYGRAARRQRLRDAFALAEAVGPLRGRVLVLVDDVATSGGTLETCARVLRAGGARAVKAFVLARS